MWGSLISIASCNPFSEWRAWTHVNVELKWSYQYTIPVVHLVKRECWYRYLRDRGLIRFIAGKEADITRMQILVWGHRNMDDSVVDIAGYALPDDLNRSYSDQIQQRAKAIIWWFGVWREGITVMATFLQAVKQCYYEGSWGIYSSVYGGILLNDLNLSKTSSIVQSIALFRIYLLMYDCGLDM